MSTKWKCLKRRILTPNSSMCRLALFLKVIRLTGSRNKTASPTSYCRVNYTNDNLWQLKAAIYEIIRIQRNGYGQALCQSVIEHQQIEGCLFINNYLIVRILGQPRWVMLINPISAHNACNAHKLHQRDCRRWYSKGIMVRCKLTVKPRVEAGSRINARSRTVWFKCWNIFQFLFHFQLHIYF